MEYIYFITTKPFMNHFKIGKTSRCVNKRLKELQTGNHLKLEIYKTVYVPKKDNLEDKLHKELKDKRRNGEWFEMNHDDVLKIFNTIPK